MKTGVFARSSLLGALGLLVTIPVHALGLGKLELSSALNEPFKAEIPITAASEEERDSLQVRLASNDEFARAGLIKTAEINQLQFKVETISGKPVITISSKKPIKEPLLDFLLLAKTSTGQLIREYTVLLDPPRSVFKDTQAAKPVAPAASPRRIISQSSVPTVDAARPGPAAPVKPKPAPSLAGSSEYGPTSSTDTLWEIALKTRPTRDVSVHQMMLAIVDKNQQAFIRGNINGLKSGYTLAIPSTSEITQRSNREAISQVNTQNQAWNNRNQATSGVSSGDTASNQASDLAVEETLPNVAVTGQQNAEPVSHLQLLGSNDELMEDNDMAAFGNDKIKELSDQLTMAQEVIESQQQENSDIKARVAEMEAQIETLRKLIELQDPDLARLQSKLEQEGADVEQQLEQMAEEIKSGLSDVDETSEQLAEEVTEETTAEATEEPLADTDMAEQAVAEQQAMADSDVATADTAQTTEPVDTAANQPESWLQRIIAFFQQHRLQALVGILGLLMALFFLSRKRTEENRKVPWNEAVGASSASAAAEPRPEPVAVSVMDEVEAEPEPVNALEELVQEADASLAKEDFARAGTLLEQARTLAPEDSTISHKLLHAYYGLGRGSDFANLAENYDVERDSIAWAQVKVWGQDLLPEHPLFAEPVIDELSLDDMALDIESDSTDVAEQVSVVEDEVTASELAVEAVEQDEIVEFSLDDDVLDTDDEELKAVVDKMDEALEFDVGDATDDLVEDSVEELADASLELGDISEAELAEAAEALAEHNDSESSEDDLSFDLSDFDQVDEAETKLDLATAYVEMGDPAGAQGILQEVMAEGNEEQQQRAEKMLNELG